MLKKSGPPHLWKAAWLAALIFAAAALLPCTTDGGEPSVSPGVRAPVAPAAALSPEGDGVLVAEEQCVVFNDEPTQYSVRVELSGGRVYLEWRPLADLLGISGDHPIYTYEQELVSLGELSGLLEADIEWSPTEERVDMRGRRERRLEDLEILRSGPHIFVDLAFNTPVDYELTSLSSPPRVVLDLPGVQLRPDQLGMEFEIEDQTAVRLRFSQRPGSVRVVLDLRYRGPEARVVTEDGGRHLRLELDRRFEHQFTSRIDSGVYYQHLRLGREPGPLYANLLKLDPERASYRLRPLLGGRQVGDLSTLSEMVMATGALAGINGGFFGPDGMPLGLVYINGQLLAEPIMNRSVLGITREGELFFERVEMGARAVISPPADDPGAAGSVAQPVEQTPTGAENQTGGETQIGEENQTGAEYSLALDGVNRSRGESQLILYTPAFDYTTRTNPYGKELVVSGGEVVDRRRGPGLIPRDGFVLSGHGERASQLADVPDGSRVELDPGLPEEWEDTGVIHALGAGPMLLSDGEIHVTGEEEGFQPSFIDNRHPRTAVGVGEGGELFLLSVNGRQHNLSTGLTLEELAAFMRELGAVDAINLDGGGSTTLMLRSSVMNIPSGGAERGIPTALVLLRR